MTIENIKISLIDYLFTEDIISKNEYSIGLKVEKAFRKQKFFNISMKFDHYGVRITGGKSIDRLPDIIAANREWLKLERLLNKNELNLIEKYIGIEFFINDINKYNENNVMKLVDVLNKLVYLYAKQNKIKLSMGEAIVMLERLVREEGICRVVEKIDIDFKTLNIIFKGKKDFKYSSIEKLFNYYGIKV